MSIDWVYSKARLKVRVDYHILLFHRSIPALLKYTAFFMSCEDQSFTVTRPVYLTVCQIHSLFVIQLSVGIWKINLIIEMGMSHMLSRGHNIGTVAFHKLLRATVVYNCTHWHINSITSPPLTCRLTLKSPSHHNIWRTFPSQDILKLWHFKQKIEKLSDFFKDCKQWHGYVTEQNRTITQGPFEVIPDLLIFLLIKTDLICSKN